MFMLHLKPIINVHIFFNYMIFDLTQEVILLPLPKPYVSCNGKPVPHGYCCHINEKHVEMEIGHLAHNINRTDTHRTEIP